MSRKVEVNASKNEWNENAFMFLPMTTLSQYVQTWFSVQLAFAKFLSKIKEKF